MTEIFINCRIPETDGVFIDNLVKDGDYLNRSDFFRKTISEKIEKIKSERKQK